MSVGYESWLVYTGHQMMTIYSKKCHSELPRWHRHHHHHLIISSFHITGVDSYLQPAGS